jgi:diketogulonate reductase-like aldo/keto reductase
MEDCAREHVTLNNKLECPLVGIGTFMLSRVDAENSVREALKITGSLIL